MDAYSSLSNRVASLEELFRRSESGVTLLLQRVKTLEEYVSGSEARHRSENTARMDALAARLEKSVEFQTSKTEALQNTTEKQALTIAKLQERLNGFTGSMEQKINSDVSGCFQWIKALETSMGATLRNVESSVQSQSSALRSVEQLMRGELQSMQQRVNVGFVTARQHVETVENDLRKTLKEVQQSAIGEVKNVSEDLVGRIRTNTESMYSSLAGLDQKLQADIKSLQESLAREINVNRQSIISQDASVRDALQALHGTLASDITNLSSRMQTGDAANQLSHQQMLTEMSSQRQEIDRVDSNWRSSLADFSGKVQTDLQNLRALHGSMEVALQQRLSLITTEMERLAGESHRTTVNVPQVMPAQFTSFDNMRDDILSTKKSLSTLRGEYSRLREDFRSLSMLVERSAAQLRSMMEATVRASHGDLLEIIKPLTGYRSDMHSAITAALNKLWIEANATFISQRDIQIVQNQIQVLDNAVRSEVALLTDMRRDLGRQSGEQKTDVTIENRSALNGESGALVQMPVAGELDNVRVELRNLQQRLGMPREEVLRVVDDLRNHVLDTMLEAARKNEDELRGILVRIQDDVRQLATQPTQNTDEGKKKKTVIRVVNSNAFQPLRSNDLPPIKNSKRKVLSHQLLQSTPEESLDYPQRFTPSAVSADGPTPNRTLKTADRLPPPSYVVPPVPPLTKTDPVPSPQELSP